MGFGDKLTYDNLNTVIDYINTNEIELIFTMLNDNSEVIENLTQDTEVEVINIDIYNENYIETMENLKIILDEKLN
jgi:ABC-type Zn uptake system ZnuABC Zn-binding protein ZnuA